MTQKIKNFLLLLLLIPSTSLLSRKIPHTVSFSGKQYKVRQGRTVRAQIKTNKKLKNAKAKFLSKVYDLRLMSEKPITYECYIPIDCDAKPGQYSLLARIENKRGKKASLKTCVEVEKVHFKKSKGFSVPASTLKKKLQRETKKNQIKKISDDPEFTKHLKKGVKKPLWTKAFGLPTKVVRYSTPFGEKRNTAQFGPYTHKAVDIVAPFKHPIWASNDGKIIIKKSYLYSGKTVIIDHGFGILTHYFHLDRFAKNIKVGDFVKKGTVIGLQGNTGYSTGHHLHWELWVNGEKVDPVEWTTKKFTF